MGARIPFLAILLAVQTAAGVLTGDGTPTSAAAPSEANAPMPAAGCPDETPLTIARSAQTKRMPTTVRVPLRAHSGDSTAGCDVRHFAAYAAM